MKTMDAFGQYLVSYNSIQVDNLKIFYLEAGSEDGRVILLLYGVPTSSRMYQPMLQSSLSTKYRLIAPDFVGFGHSSWPSRKEFSYTFDNLVQVTRVFVDALLTTLYLHDYGGPVGMCMVVAELEKVEASIIQNAVSHEEALSPLWTTWCAFWQDRASHEAAFRKSFLSLETTRNRHLGTSPHPERIDPDTWTDEFYFLNRPGQADIQTDLFF